MTWLTPALAGIVAAVAIPALLILYFLKLRRRDVDVSSTLLWKKSVRDMQANAPFQRLRRNILLILQLLALIVLIAALAQPERKGDLGAGGRSVLVIDRSASMGAIEDAGARTSRLDKAKEEARAFVRAMREPNALSRLSGAGADEAMLVAFDQTAVVMQPFTSSKPLLLAAIDAIEPTDAPTSVLEAFRLAGAHAKPVLVENRGLVSSPGAPIHLWSDGAIPDAAAVVLQPDTSVTFHRVGEASARNIGVTALRAERAYENPGRLSVFVGVRSTDVARRAVDVELSINGVVAAIRPVAFALPPDASAPQGPLESGVVFTVDRAEGAILSVRVIADDALAADDRAWLAVPPARRAEVLLVTGGADYLQTALEGLNLASLRIASPAQAEPLLRAGAGGPAFDVVILDSWAPETPLPPGRYLVLGAMPILEGVSRGAGGAQPAGVVDYDRAHPALRRAMLDSLLIAESSPLTAGEGARILVRGERGPLMVEVFDGPVHAIVSGFDPADSNWPFDASMIIFLADAIAHLARDPSLDDAGALRPGSPIVATLPAGARDVEIVDPSGAAQRLEPSPDGRIVFGPAPRAGVYSLRWSGPAGPSDEEVSGRIRRALAVNLLDPFETDIGSRESIDLPTGAVGAAASDLDSGAQRLWPWLILVALGALTLEWWVYNRRVHI